MIDVDTRAMGQMLRQARVAQRLTQDQLECLSGVSQETISLLERGSLQHPRFLAVMRLARVLDLEPSTFLTFKDFSQA